MRTGADISYYKEDIKVDSKGNVYVSYDTYDKGNYDVKKTIETIVLSRAYQLPSEPIGENAKEYVFAGPCFKKMTAEQFADGVSTLTGVWPA